MTICDRCLAKNATKIRLLIDRGINDRIKQTRSSRTSIQTMELCNQCIQEFLQTIDRCLAAFLHEGDEDD